MIKDLGIRNGTERRRFVMTILCSFSKPGVDELKEIQNLEKELGVTLLAFSCPETKLAPNLTDEQIKKIREIENKVGMILMAVQ